MGMFSGVNSLEKLILGPDFSFDGDGKVTENKAVLPAPVGGGKWYNADSGDAYLASEIPELTAATYVAAPQN